MRTFIFNSIFFFLLLTIQCTNSSELAPDKIAPERLMINEIMVQNTWTLADEDGDYGPWIELYNGGSGVAHLKGWALHSMQPNEWQWSLPDIDLKSGEYLVVFMSGKDRQESALRIHANVQVDPALSDLALLNPQGEIFHAWAGGLPQQYQNISFGYVNEFIDGPVVYLNTPTPGASNGSGTHQYTIRSPELSHVRGYYDKEFNLEIRARGESDIYFTLDGSVPSKSNGTLFLGPISVQGTTIVRAVSVSEEFGVSSVETHTLLFTNDVLTSEVMQPSIVSDPLYGALLDSSIVSLPTVSIVRPEGIATDVPVAASVEFFDPEQKEQGFQIDCGIKKVGGHSLGFSKVSMRLYFRKQFGPSKLEYSLFAKDQLFAEHRGATEFDQLHLRSGSHDSIFYLGADTQSPSNAQYIRNRWMQDTLFRMGQFSTRGRFVQVFLNGEYRGMYHLQERPTQSYMASYLGGSKEDFAYVNSGISDDIDVWAQVKNSLNDWESAQSWLDIDSLIDYQLLHYYAGNDWDWLENRNWMAAGPRTPNAGGWKIFAWDDDISFISEMANNTDPDSFSRTNNPMNAPDSVFTDLRIHPEFMERVQERILLHFYGEGVLTPRKVIESYSALADKVELPLVGEMARWGNAKGKNWRLDTDWEPEKIRLLESYFVNRTELVLEQLAAEGLFSFP